MIQYKANRRKKDKINHAHLLHTVYTHMYIKSAHSKHGNVMLKHDFDRFCTIQNKVCNLGKFSVNNSSYTKQYLYLTTGKLMKQVLELVNINCFSCIIYTQH